MSADPTRLHDKRDGTWQQAKNDRRMRVRLTGVLRPRLEVEDRRRNSRGLGTREALPHRHDAAAVSVDAEIVAEEGCFRAGRTGEGLLIDLVIDEGLAAVGAAGEDNARLGVFEIAAIEERDVDRAVDRVDGHPREELLLAVALRIVVDAQRLRPR